LTGRKEHSRADSIEITDAKNCRGRKHVVMALRTGRRLQGDVVATSTVRRDALTLIVAAILLVVVVGGCGHVVESRDVFASSAHLRQLADSERMLVPAVRRYVAHERRRLVHVLRYDRRIDARTRLPSVRFRS